MNNKKKIILSVLVVLLLLVVGVTYAFFTYESGTKSDIVTGQIYMNYEETSTISLTGVFPETKEQALARQDENGVFEFTITGRNTSKYPVYYEIDLLEGGVMTGKTEQSTKILPEHVRIYLERDGDPLVDGMTYKDWNNRRIYVDTVPAGTTSNIEHKYTLRMWIDENVTISDTDPDADYTTSEWNDAYTSLKVRVVGDFEYKEIATDATCFEYRVIASSTEVVLFDYPIITLDTSKEKVETCMSNMMNYNGEDGSDTQDGYKSYCEGTGTIYDGYSLKDDVDWQYSNGASVDEINELFVVVTDITYETRYYELDTSEESVNACKEYMLNTWNNTDFSDAQDGYQSYCEGTGTVSIKDGNSSMSIENVTTIYTLDNISDARFMLSALIDLNVFRQNEGYSNNGIRIVGYDETCGTDVVIPTYIDGLPVVEIGDEDLLEGAQPMNNSNLGNVYGSSLEKVFDDDYRIETIAVYKGVFERKNITSVVFPQTLQYIGIAAFDRNNLIEVIIPDSVKEIGNAAFSYNPLITVNIKSNPTLGSRSFRAIYPDDINKFQTFQYAGTCAELNQYENVFNGSAMPQQIITSDTNSCTYTGPVTDK